MTRATMRPWGSVAAASVVAAVVVATLAAAAGLVPGRVR